MTILLIINFILLFFLCNNTTIRHYFKTEEKKNINKLLIIHSRKNKTKIQEIKLKIFCKKKKNVMINCR